MPSVPWHHFAERLPAPPETKEKEPTDPRPTADLFAEFPWLREVFPASAGHGGHGGGGSAGDAWVRKEVDPDSLTASMQALADKRAAWDVDDRKETTPDFFTHIRGGRGTLEVKGKACDFWRAEARDGEPKKFSMKYGMGLTKDFSLSKYGELAASQMAVEACNRWQHYYDIYKDANDDAFEFQPLHTEGYEEGCDWIACLAAMKVDDVAWDRSREIRAFAPGKRR